MEQEGRRQTEDLARKKPWSGKKTVLGCVGVFCGVLAALWLTLVLAAAIPNALLQSNMEKSALSYKERDAFEFTRGDRWCSIADNYADTILLGVAWNMGEGDPVTASLDTKYNDGGELGESVGLYLTVTGLSPEANTDYTRYWHGSAAPVRLLHLITDVAGVRIIGFILILALALLTLAMLLKRRRFAEAAALTLALLAVRIWDLSLSMEYQSAFILCFALCPLYITLEKRGNAALYLLSVAGGVLTAFFDFLTAETLVILIPLILVLAARSREGRLGGFKEALRLVLMCLLCWLLAYAGAFIVKWALASLATGRNEFALALSSALPRTVGSVLGEGPEGAAIIPAAVLANLSTLFGGTERMQLARVAIGLAVTAAVLGTVYYLFRREGEKSGGAAIILLTGAAVFLRFMILSNHSYLHEFFTYRALAAPITALLTVMLMNMSAPLRRRTKV